jgi:soluble lytic murein transglycosylase-like protein
MGFLWAVLVVIVGLIVWLLLPSKLGAATLPERPAAGVVPAKYPYADLFQKWGARYNVDPALGAAHAKVESSFNPGAVNFEDPDIDYDSSYGLLQVQLAVAQDFGKVKDYRNPTSAEISWLMVPSNNVQVGVWNIGRWQHKYPFEVAVQMYNVGERGYNVKGYRAAGYLRKVREAYDAYKIGD